MTRVEPTAERTSESDVNVNTIASAQRKTEVPLTPSRKLPVEKFVAAPPAIAELKRRHGPESSISVYSNIRREPIAAVVRWDLPDGRQDVRTVSRHGDEWRISGMPEPLQLYGLPDLASAKRVYICEDEKAVDAARSSGLVATTSADGWESPEKTDLQPLAGKEVFLMPHADPARSKYAEALAGLLARLEPTAMVRLGEQADQSNNAAAAVAQAVQVEEIADESQRVVEAPTDVAEPMSAMPPAELSAEVEPANAADPVTLFEEAAPSNARRPVKSMDRFVPFPVDELPEPLRRFVADGARAIGCDPSYLALPVLSVLGAAIGNSRRIQLKPGWTAPPIIWVAIVGESGTAKTPAFRQVLKPLRERERLALVRQAAEERQYEADLAQYEKDVATWKRQTKTTDPPPQKPEAPQATRFIVGDITVEALVPLLQANPRGMLVAQDELAGWFGSFDRYSGGKGGRDAAQWLSMYNAETISVDRKSGVQRTIYVPQAAVSVCGGIQPAILHRALGTEHRESGLAARLLLSWPPRKAKRWTEAHINPMTEAEYCLVVDRLCELDAAAGPDGALRPVEVGLSPDAKALWTAFYDSHAQEQTDLVGDLSAAWSKLEETAARLALIIHFARWAADDPTLLSVDVVDCESMAAGIALTTWFKGETRRVYARLGECDDERGQRQLVEWIERKGGSVTARDVQMGCRWLREPGEAEAALRELEKTGLGSWETSPPGQRGQPTRRLRLSCQASVNGNVAEPLDAINTVDVDTVDGSASQLGAEWGEL